MSRLKRALGRPIASLLEWTDPLHIARRLLRDEIRKRAHYGKGSVLDLGSGGQPYRDVFGQATEYVALDAAPDARIDVRGDGMALPFKDAAFDTVVCSEVLEHVSEPSSLVGEVARTLKPGGVLLLTTPQTWGLHHEPHDYYRFTRYGLCYLAEKESLEVLEIVPTCGLWATLTQRLADTIAHVYLVGHSRHAIRLVSFLLAPILMAGYGLDRLFGKRGDTLDYVLVARKPYDPET